MPANTTMWLSSRWMKTPRLRIDSSLFDFSKSRLLSRIKSRIFDLWTLKEFYPNGTEQHKHEMSFSMLGVYRKDWCWRWNEVQKEKTWPEVEWKKLKRFRSQHFISFISSNQRNITSCPQRHMSIKKSFILMADFLLVIWQCWFFFFFFYTKVSFPHHEISMSEGLCH